ncbi:MAG: transposase [Pseudomonadota bacterium]
MPRRRNPYPAEFREQLVALVRTGRSVESLSREYDPRAATIHEWVRQATADDGDEPAMLTSQEREELRQLRREGKQLRQERDILSKGRSVKAPLVQAQWTTLGLHKTT